MAPLFVLLLAFSAPAASGLPEEGMRAYEDMDLDAARDAFTKAQRAAPARERPRLELWLGIIELERGNEAAARRWLRSALQASPGLAVPASVSPKVRTLVEELRPAVKATRQTRAAGRARASSAPPPTIAATAPALPPPVPPPPAPPPPAPPPPQQSAEPVAETVASLTTPAPPPMQVANPAAPAAPAPAPEAPLATTSTVAPLPSPMLLAGAGAGVLAVGAVGGGVVLGAFAAQAAADAEGEARAVDATARYQWANATAWLANGMYALGAVSAAVGVGCATVALAGAAE